MPKSIIREIDRSDAGINLSSNFAVFVPGYVSTVKDNDAVRKNAILAGVYFEDANIYKLTSTKQFIEYVGKFNGQRAVEASAPTLEVFNPVLEEEGEWALRRYSDHLSVSQFKDVKDAYFYKGDTVEHTDPLYMTNGRLVKTFKTGLDTYETVVFTKVTEQELWEDLPTQEAADENADPEIVYGQTEGIYYKILIGNEGTDYVAKTSHIGNQIAFELLQLGYTVYFGALKSNEDATVQLKRPEFWAPLKSRSTYRLRYITSGGCYDSTVAQNMVDVASFYNLGENKVTVENADIYDSEQPTGRGDCIALLDIDEEGAAFSGSLRTKLEILTAFGAGARALPASKYAAIFAPRVVYANEDSDYGTDIKFPCSFHYLACAAQSQSRYAEWYAVAGYTRGVSSKSIAYTTYTFGDIDINTLAPRVANTFAKAGQGSINLILNERGNYYLWGNRTAEPIDAKGLRFSHFLNIRQLCCTIKQVLYDATRQFTFDPNSDLLWINFVTAIRPTLESMKADQGISGYLITKVATDKKALLKAIIRIVPIEAVEDFDISIYLENDLTGIVVTADEQEAE